MDIADLDEGLHIATDEEIPTFTHDIECTKLNGQNMPTITDDLREHEDVYDKLLGGIKIYYHIRMFCFTNKRTPAINMGMLLIVNIEDKEFRYNIKIPGKMIEFVFNSPVLLIITRTKRPMFGFTLEPLKEEMFECYQQTLINRMMLDLMDEQPKDKVERD